MLARNKLAIFLLIVLFFGCTSDIRDCANCYIQIGNPIYYKLVNNSDSIFLSYFSKDYLNIEQDFYKLNHTRRIDSFIKIGFKLDTIKYNGTNYFPNYFYFNKNIDDNLLRVNVAFKSSNCRKYQVNCKEIDYNSPCCK